MMFRQAGLALLSMLLLLALATIMATAMISRLDQANAVSSLLDFHMRATAYAQGEENALIAQLKQDQQINPNSDHRQENWALPQRFELPDGEVQGQLIDQSGCFNLNNLYRSRSGGQSMAPVVPAADGSPAGAASGPPDIDPEAVAYLGRLLNQAGLGTELAQAVQDWIDADEQTTAPGGAESDFYQGQQVPYTAANQRLYTLSELGKIRGFDQNALQAVQSLLCVQPQPQPFNINTAPASLLAALDDSITPAAASAWVAYRDQGHPLDQPASLWAQSGFNAVPTARRTALEKLFTVKSAYYQASIVVILDGQASYLNSALMRTGDQVQVYQRDSYSPLQQQLAQQLSAPR